MLLLIHLLSLLLLLLFPYIKPYICISKYCTMHVDSMVVVYKRGGTRIAKSY